MVNVQPLRIDSHGLYDLIVQPMFADILPTYSGPYKGCLSEFTVVDNISLSRGTPLIDFFGKQNIMRQRDNTCNVIWSKVADTASRRIVIDAVYGATQVCQNEFYSGCLKDFRNKAGKFREMVLMYFQKAFYMDIAVNSYFGDKSAIPDTTGVYNWNSFDGILTHIARYITAGTIPAGQTYTLPTGSLSGSQANTAFAVMFGKRDKILRTMPRTDQAYYCSQFLAEAWEQYLIDSGLSGGGIVGLMLNGIPVLAYKQIPIFVEPIWDDVLLTMNGGSTQKHLCILTIRGNFVFGTNSSYGGGANEDEGLKVWYDEDEEVWKWKTWGAYGTELLSPKQVVIGN